MKELHSFDRFLAASLREWRVPAAAVAIVKDGAVVLARGYGCRDLEQDARADENTMFAIASSTKAFTAMGAGLLVEDGKLAWDEPIKEYLASFRLRDAFATERITMRDLLCHRSGLPRHDVLAFSGSYSREELIARLRHLEPNCDFRTQFQYQNLMYVTAGYVVGVVAGSSWEAFTKERILDPLGMKDSNFSVREMQARVNHASPYRDKHGEIARAAFRDISELGPAGAVNSTATDMAKWLLLNLGHGPEGMVSASTLREMQVPQMVIGNLASVQSVPRGDELGHVSYGLGWFVHSYHGQPLLHHAGNIDGFTCQVAFMPRQNVGVVALVNRNRSFLPLSIAFNVFDRFLGVPEVAWNDRLRQQSDRIEAAAKAARVGDTTRHENAPHSHPLDDYVGKYEHPAYGTMEIEHRDGRLSARFHAVTLELAHLHFDVFEAVYPFEDLRTLLRFVTDTEGNVSGLRMTLEPNVEPIAFQRVADKRMRDVGFLQPFVGRYSLAGQDAAVTLRKDGTLIASLPGQGDVELEPCQNTTFKVKGLPVSIEFMGSHTAAVTGVKIKYGATEITASRA